MATAGECTPSRSSCAGRRDYHAPYCKRRCSIEWIERGVWGCAPERPPCQWRGRGRRCTSSSPRSAPPPSPSLYPPVSSSSSCLLLPVTPATACARVRLLSRMPPSARLQWPAQSLGKFDNCRSAMQQIQSAHVGATRARMVGARCVPAESESRAAAVGCIHGHKSARAPDNFVVINVTSLAQQTT